MGSELQLDVCHLNRWWRHLVNAYEVNGFCHTGPISLRIDLFVFLCVYFVYLCFILHSRCIIVSTVRWIEA